MTPEPWQNKIKYHTVTGPYLGSSTAYTDYRLGDRVWATNKHSDAPLVLMWHPIRERWEEVELDLAHDVYRGWWTVREADKTVPFRWDGIEWIYMEENR